MLTMLIDDLVVLASPLARIVPLMIVYMGLMGLGTLLVGGSSQQRFFLGVIVFEKFMSASMGFYYGDRIGGVGYIAPNLVFGIAFLSVLLFSR